MYKLSNITDVYVKQNQHGYAVYADLDNLNPIMLDWFYENENLALHSMKYIKENVLERID